MGLRGFPADAFFGASPVVASALGFRLGATPRGPFNITRTFADGPPKGTFLLCWGRGHFYFAATYDTARLLLLAISFTLR
jgi:hypothetical protein